MGNNDLISLFILKELDVNIRQKVATIRFIVRT